MVALIVRCAGRSWNDVVDGDIDPLVERTRSRPIARGSISFKKGGVFSWAQLGLGLWIFRGLLDDGVDQGWIKYMVPLVGLGFAYPFAKRVMDYAQVVLGIALGWGVLVRAAVVGVDFLSWNRWHGRKGGSGSLGLAAL